MGRHADGDSTARGVSGRVRRAVSGGAAGPGPRVGGGRHGDGGGGACERTDVSVLRTAGIWEASPLEPLHIPAAWDAVTFPLSDGATSGEMTFGVPTDPSFRGDWVFEATFRFLNTSEFVNRKKPVGVSYAAEVR